MRIEDMRSGESNSVGVAVQVAEDQKEVTVRCLACGREWKCKATGGGHLGHYWYLCPDGCNDDGRGMPDLKAAFGTMAGPLQCASGAR
jgi:hypothetical protein